jgi:hypothetical protein
MKQLLVGLLAGSLVALCGCDTGKKSSAGGPGVTGSSRAAGTSASRESKYQNPPDTTGTRETKHPSEGTFTISVPSGRTDVKQGQQKEVSIKVSRDRNFAEDVKLTFKADEGITVEPSSHTVKASDADTTVKAVVKVANTAKVGDHKIDVMAAPTAGKPTSQSFTVKVAAP